MSKKGLYAVISSSTVVPVILIVTFSVLLSSLLTGMLMMRPVADDFAYFSDPLISNPFGFAVHYYMDWTGRFMQAFWMSTLYRVFGDEVVTYGALIQYLLLISASLFVSFSVLKRSTLSKLWLVAIGLSLATLSVFMTPSIFDSNLWITSSTVYIGSMIGLLIAVGSAALLAQTDSLKWWKVAIASIVIFAAQLFSEPTSLIAVGIGLLALLVHYLFIKTSRSLAVCWTWLLASASGFLFMYLSPGTAAREGELDTKASLVGSMINALGDFDKLSYIFTSYRILIIASLVIVTTPLLLKLSTKTKLIIAMVSAISMVAIPFVLFLATHYSLGGYAPLRAFTTPSALFSVALIVFISSLLAIAINYTKIKPQDNRATNLITLALLLVIVPATFSCLKQVAPTIQAVAQRAELYDAREESITAQVLGKNDEVYIQPLPLLLTTSDAVDLYFNDGTPVWLEKSFRDYYGIPSTSKIIFESQPEGYCVQYDNPYWFGTKTCGDINE